MLNGQTQAIETIIAWLLSALVYPGLLFGVALALVSEWALNAVRPIFTPRIYRSRRHAHHLIQPIYDFLKLAGRQTTTDAILTGASLGKSHPLHTSLAFMSTLAPVLALTLLPFPGSSITQATGPVGDIFLVVALLVAQPICKAAIRLNHHETTLRGAQDLGRLLVGLLPTLAALAALMEVSGSKSLQIAALTVAPETAAQALVRLLAGAALLVALPWWLDWIGTDGEAHDSAGTYAGRYLQRAALAAFWVLVVLPMPGDPAWAVAVSVGGSLVAYIAIRMISERWASGMREKDAARLVWATSLPVIAIALIAAFWSGV